MNAIRPASPSQTLVVGIVNNIQSTAAAAVSVQFARLLVAGRPVRVRRFAADVAGHEPLESLWTARLDGLVVTGAEPLTTCMGDEPSWPLLRRLIEWAAVNTAAAIWSCLAAHAVTFRLDGIARRRLPRKVSGVFACRKLGDHPLLPTMAAEWLVPHSRWNDLDPAALAGSGYELLALGPDGFVDTFARRVGDSQFLMLQGHPEYGADMLLREYRRDLRRHLDGHSAAAPTLPTNYLGSGTEAALRTLDDPARRLTLLEAAMPAPTWQPAAAALFRAWLDNLVRPAEPAPESGLVSYRPETARRRRCESDRR